MTAQNLSILMILFVSTDTLGVQPRRGSNVCTFALHSRGLFGLTGIPRDVAVDREHDDTRAVVMRSRGRGLTYVMGHSRAAAVVLFFLFIVTISGTG